MRAVVADLAARVEQGQPLSVAMLAHSSVFSGMFTGVIRAGEAAGILEDSLRRLADLLERRAMVYSRLRAALAMPLMALIVEIIVIGLIVFVAMPKMLAAYPDPDKLPESTKTLMGIVHWTTDNWVLVTLLLGALISGIVLALRLPAGRAAFQSAVLRIPIIGNIVRQINVARFSRTLGSLTAAGIPLIDAIGIAAETSDNAVVERVLLRTRDAVETGGKMEESLRSEPVFDEIVVDMVAIGDEAGALDTVLLKVADTYDADVDSTLRGLSSLLEPFLIVLLGLGVAFVAVAAFTPYLKLVTSPVMMNQ
jgi:type IV pilus assembly protein PilC